ncbi:MAG: hypothetical protein ACM3H9_00910, partial [Rhodospirillaceae bacterium]
MRPSTGSSRRRAARIAAACSMAAFMGLAAAAAGPQAPAAPAPGAPLSFDMVVVDRDGRTPQNLGPGDLTVTVDGKPRRLLAVRRVSRGPGASADAAAQQARAAGPATFAAEPVRNVLVVLDQASLVRGEERAAVTASQALLDRLGMADRLAVVLLPLPRDQMLSLDVEQPVARETLAKALGQIDPAVVARPDDPAFTPAANPMLSDPERLREAEPVPVTAPVPATREPEITASTGALAELAGLLEALRTVPGRKVVALFSAGVGSQAAAQVPAVAAAAIAARTSIHVFSVPGPRDGAGANLQVAPLETLARSTGGTTVSVARNPERAIARTVSEMAACYVVELEPTGTDGDGRRHTLRVEVAGRGLSVRAPAWLVPSADPGDQPAAPPAPAPASTPGTAMPATSPDAGARPPQPSEVPSAKEAELQLAMARLAEYVEAYEHRYSGLVAEEEYLQSSRGKNVRLRSDYLLVRPEKSPDWISFRDVFEVDGVPVRDRDDRLKRLFLAPGVDTETQLLAIVMESARYNIGAVERRLNVPLFLLRFLAPEDR